MNFWLLALAGLTALRLLLAAQLPLSPDEAYYWVWSVHVQPGYFDHPPMVALWIKAGTALLGNIPLGVRFLGPLAAAAGSVLLWRAGEDFFPKRQAGLVAAALFNATLILGVGSILMTPDTPLVFFWTAALAALGRLHATGEKKWWLAVGAAAGAALLSKYTGLLLLAGIFGWLISRPSGRSIIKNPWPWGGVAVAALMFAPDVVWNAGHGWVSYFKQGGRVAGFDFGRAGQFFGELLVGQIFLVTPIVFVLAVFGVWRLRRVADGPARLILWLTLLPAAVFVEHCLTGRVESNWPAVMLPAAFLAAAALPEKWMLKWLRPAMGLGFGLTLIVYAQALAAPFALPARLDPTALQFAGWQGLADAVAAKNPVFVTSDEYATLSQLAYDLPAGVTVAGYDRRWMYFNLPPAVIAFGAPGMMVTRRGDTPCPDLIGTYERKRGNQVVMRYKFCRFAATQTMVVLPHP